MQQAQQFHQLQQKTQQMQQMEQTAAHNNGKEESKTASSSTASPPLETCSADVDYCLQQLDAQMSASEAYKLADIHATLQNQSKMSDMSFAMTISSLSSCEQFIYTMERWAQQVQSAQMHLRALVSNTTQKTFHIPIGSYIHSSATGKYYLNLGVEAKTLQGCIYIGYEYSDWFIERVIADECVNFCKLIAFAIKPTLAIKYYDKKCCDLGVTLNGIPVKEKALQEIKITKSIYRNSRRNHLIRGPMLPWLPQPHHNIIKPIENWEDYERKCYFMITEFANCGELFLFIDSYHPIIYREKKLNIKRIDEIKNSKLRELSIRVYRDSLRTSSDGSNAYIELARFLFQQMVQAVHTLHCQGIAHLDISCENFVLHFDPSDGEFLAKLIDFGRATKMKPKPHAMKYALPYQKYDFTVATYPGKCRYMSPESALFLRYKDADPYDASKEDIYALGVVLFCLLTCRLPYDSPFYIEDDDKDEAFGYLNGNKKYKIDLRSMTYVKTGKPVNAKEMDETFKFLQRYGVAHLLHQNCLLDYVSDDSLHLLDQIFRKRMSLSELIAHPFVTTPPNPQLLMAMIQHVVDYKGLEYADQEKHIHITTQQIDKLYQNRIKIQAHYIAALTRVEEVQVPLHVHALMDEIPIIQPPIIETSLTQPVIVSPSAVTETPKQPVSSVSIADILPESLHLAQSLASPSPPPQANYICSPSPELASFSPSPEPFDSASISSEHGMRTRPSRTNEDQSHTNLIHNLLEAHFHVTCS
eukprot:16724_1